MDEWMEGGKGGCEVSRHCLKREEQEEEKKGKEDVGEKKKKEVKNDLNDKVEMSLPFYLSGKSNLKREISPEFHHVLCFFLEVTQ